MPELPNNVAMGGHDAGTLLVPAGLVGVPDGVGLLSGQEILNPGSFLLRVVGSRARVLFLLFIAGADVTESGWIRSQADVLFVVDVEFMLNGRLSVKVLFFEVERVGLMLNISFKSF